MIMESEAELRRQRFLAAKEEAGGTAGALIRSNAKKPAYVYFDITGTILCVTTDSDIEPLPHWTHKHEFTQEQVEILKGKNHNLFYVKQDPLVENLFSIENRSVESQYVTVEEEFLSLIPKEKTAGYDIKCKLSSTEFTVTAHKNLIKQYDGIEPSNMVAKGKKILKFYITAENDPHFMFSAINVSLANLVTTGEVTIKTSEDFSQCSIYTPKAFDKYVRT
jgi:hypothetical protein